MKKHARRWSRLRKLFALSVVTIAASAAVAPAANAAFCDQLSHGQMSYNGGVYFSGYEGDHRFGVPTVTLGRLEKDVTVGGIVMPGTTARFELFNASGGLETRTFSLTAGDNCVSNEVVLRKDIFFSSGTYTLKSRYVSWTTGSPRDETVATIVAP
jgi:hypothetical protein